MIKLQIPISFIVLFFILFTSCSNDEKTLTNQYWVRYKKSKPSYIVKFKSNGDFINYNKLNDKLTYKIIQGRLIIADKKGESKKYFIKQISNDLLELSRIDELGTKDIDLYRKAKKQDLFLGKWYGNNPSKFLNTSFEANGKVKIQVNVNDYLAKINTKYKLKDTDIIFINKTVYKFKMTNDLMKLTLTDSTGKTYILKRKE